MHRLTRLRRRGDIATAAKTIPDFRYPNTLDRVEPLVKAGVIPPPEWLDVARLVPPVIAEPWRPQRRLEFPTDRLVHLYQKRNPQILEEPLDLRPGREPSIAYTFAQRQLALMQSGVSEADAYARVEVEMTRERGELVEKAASVAKEARQEVGGALPASVAADEKIQHGLAAWKEAIAEMPYQEWGLGAKVALDMFLIRSICGVSRTNEKHMNEVNDGSWERLEHEAAVLRCALFPNTAAMTGRDRSVFADLPAWKTAAEIAADPTLAARAAAFRSRAAVEPDFWRWAAEERKELLDWVNSAVLVRDNVAVKVAESIDYFAYREGRKEALTDAITRPFVFDAVSELFPMLELVDLAYVMRLKRAEVQAPGTLRRVWQLRKEQRRDGDGASKLSDNEAEGEQEAADGRPPSGGSGSSGTGWEATQHIRVPASLALLRTEGWAPKQSPAFWPHPPARRAWGAGPLLDEAINDYVAEQDRVVRQGMRRRRMQERRAALTLWQMQQAEAAATEAREAELAAKVAVAEQKQRDREAAAWREDQDEEHEEGQGEKGDVAGQERSQGIHTTAAAKEQNYGKRSSYASSSSSSNSSDRKWGSSSVGLDDINDVVCGHGDTRGGSYSDVAGSGGRGSSSYDVGGGSGNVNLAALVDQVIRNSGGAGGGGGSAADSWHQGRQQRPTDVGGSISDNEGVSWEDLMRDLNKKPRGP